MIEAILKEEFVFTLNSIVKKFAHPELRSEISQTIAQLCASEQVVVVGEDLNGWNIYEVVK